MNILKNHKKDITHLITTISRGGAENQLLTLVKAQINSGAIVTVIYLKDKPDLKNEFMAAGAKVNDNFSNLNPLLQIFGLWKYFKNHATIIHSHLPRAEIFAAITKSKNTFVISRHNAESFIPKKPGLISIALSRYCVNRSNSVICISKANSILMKNLKEIGNRREIEVVHYAIDEDFKNLDISRSNLRVELKLTNRFVVGTAARLVEQKDYPTLLYGFSEFLTNLPEAILIVLGSGDLEMELKNLAIKIGISEKIIWVGKTDKVKEYMKIFDVFAFTSLGEGFGLVLLEAMFTGTPIVAANNSAVPEVIGENHPGLFKTGNSKELSNKLVELSDEIRREDIIRIQNERLNMFDSIKMSQKIDAIYEKAVAK